MRVLLTISYDGTNYSGWQRQTDAVSVQETVENALKTLTKKNIKIVGSGRTDAGVHAEWQTAHFDTDESIPAENYYKALNTVLPEDIKIIKSERVDDGFDATRHAKKKTYRYTFFKGDVELPLFSRYAVMLPKNTDTQKAKSISQIFVGKHNFKGFSASGTGALTFDREIFEIKAVEDEKFLKFYVTGGGFLYKMVRMVVGTIIGFGQGRLDKKDIEKSFESGEQIKNVTTLPAKGLCLVKVEYEK